MQQRADRFLNLRSILTDLQREGYLSVEDVETIANTPRSAEDSKLHPLTFIAKKQLPNLKNPGGYLGIDVLVDWLARQAGQSYYRIDPLKVDATAVTDAISYSFAKRHGILAVEINRDEAVIASAEPYVSSWEADIEHILSSPIRRVIADPEDIDRYTIELYTLARSIKGATGLNNQSSAASGVTNLEAMLELGEKEDPDANDAHIVKIVDWLLQYAFDQRSSDIHVEPRRVKGNVRFRIDGVMHTVYEMPMSVLTAVVSRLKILARLNVAEKRRPQDGRLKTKNPQGREIELRLSTMPTAFGEKLVMRIFDPDVLLRTTRELGLVGEDFTRWDAMTSKPNGIVLVTGPTGSGKTTTLYSSLKALAVPEVNVCTIEDPIEMVEPAFNQMQVQHSIDIDFASGIRALLRQDPDIIMVGEIRDSETAEMAVQAALTGHLVISTLHTNDAPTAVTRMLELGIPSYLIRATLLGVMAQRLVRTLCEHCKVEAEIDEYAWKELTAPWKVNLPKKMYKAAGCLECRNTGYLGRVGLYEILVMSEKVRQTVSSDCDLDAMRKLAMREGMRTLRLSGAQKVASGVTTIEEVMRVAPAPSND